MIIALFHKVLSPLFGPDGPARKLNARKEDGR